MKLFIVLIVSFFLSGCAPEMLITSLTDPYYQPSDSERFYIMYPYSHNISDRIFIKALRHEMKELDLTVVSDPSRATKILYYSFDSYSGEINSYHAVPSFSNTKGKIGDTSFDANTTGTDYVPYTSSYLSKILFIDIYDKNSQHVWQASVSADYKDFDENLNSCVKELLTYYGKNFHDWVSIK